MKLALNSTKNFLDLPYSIKLKDKDIGFSGDSSRMGAQWMALLKPDKCWELMKTRVVASTYKLVA